MRTRFAFVTVAAVLLATLATASSVRAQGVGFGIKLGPTFTTLNSEVLDFESRTGFQGGIFIGGNRDGLFGAQAEVLYAKRSAETEQLGLRTDLHFISIPALIRLNIGSRNRNSVALYAIGGPSIDINLKAEQNDLDIKDNYETVDIGLLGGGGIEIARIIFEGRYSWGLRDVFEATLLNRDTHVKTNSFAVMVGFRFN